MSIPTCFFFFFFSDLDSYNKLEEVKEIKVRKHAHNPCSSPDFSHSQNATKKEQEGFFHHSLLSLTPLAKFLDFLSPYLTFCLRLFLSDQTVEQISIRNINGMTSDSRVSMRWDRYKLDIDTALLFVSNLLALFRPDSGDFIRCYHVLLSTSSRHLTKIHREMSAAKNVDTSRRRTTVTSAVSEPACIDIDYHRNIVWINSWLHEQVYIDLIPIPVRGLLTAAVVSCCIIEIKLIVYRKKSPTAS